MLYILVLNINLSLFVVVWVILRRQTHPCVVQLVVSCTKSIIKNLKWKCVLSIYFLQLWYDKKNLPVKLSNLTLSSLLYFNPINQVFITSLHLLLSIVDFATFSHLLLSHSVVCYSDIKKILSLDLWLTLELCKLLVYSSVPNLSQYSRCNQIWIV